MGMARLPRVIAAACTAVLLTGHVTAAEAPTGPALQVKLDVQAGKGDKPMIVAWLEDTEHNFVATLQVLSKDRKHYKELTAWNLRRKDREAKEAVDAVTGATMKWGESRTLTVPMTTARYNLLNGGYVLRFESAKDHGSHFQTLKIPIDKGFAGGTFTDTGYVHSVTVAVLDKGSDK